jgi:hypothetical protein
MKATGTVLTRTDVVMHMCDTPACYRLDHLQLGTQAENAADMKAKGRGRNQNSGIPECRRGHAFTEDNTYVDQTGRRHCRTCSREWADQRRRDEGVWERKRECKRGHAFTPENTYIDPRGGQICRTCQRDRENQRRRDAGIPRRGPYRRR